MQSWTMASSDRASTRHSRRPTLGIRRPYINSITVQLVAPASVTNISGWLHLSRLLPEPVKCGFQWLGGDARNYSPINSCSRVSPINGRGRTGTEPSGSPFPFVRRNLPGGGAGQHSWLRSKPVRTDGEHRSRWLHAGAACARIRRQQHGTEANALRRSRWRRIRARGSVRNGSCR